jgi:hypothetical protein
MRRSDLLKKCLLTKQNGVKNEKNNCRDVPGQPFGNVGFPSADGVCQIIELVLP